MPRAKLDWIKTYSGKRFYPFDPHPEDICIEDIAHALALQCRFTGHCAFHYSVAQHSLLVASLCPPQDRLWGLLHDASEAYIVDFATPVKHHPLMQPYRDVEEMIMQAVQTKFNLGECPESVHIADREALSIEANALMGDVSDWCIDPPKHAIHIPEHDYRYIEHKFVRTFKHITEGTNGL